MSDSLKPVSPKRAGPSWTRPVVRGPGCVDRRPGFSARIILVFLISVLLTQRREEKQRGISVATDGAQTHFISLLKPKNASVLNCSACVFIGNKCPCFVWVEVKGSYSVGINNRKCFETEDGQSDVTGRSRSERHFKTCLCSGLDLYRWIQRVCNREEAMCMLLYIYFYF